MGSESIRCSSGRYAVWSSHSTGRPRGRGRSGSAQRIRSRRVGANVIEVDSLAGRYCTAETIYRAVARIVDDIRDVDAGEVLRGIGIGDADNSRDLPIAVFDSSLSYVDGVVEVNAGSSRGIYCRLVHVLGNGPVVLAAKGQIGRASCRERV